MRRLEALSAANLSKELSILKDLITARMLLSSGQMNESLALFGRVLDAEESGLWGFDIVARKNQMLTIESIVAAYDCGDFPLAIKYGEYIYEKIQGAGSVPECYCLSWLSLAYYKYGLTERAQEHLGKAKAVFNHSCESSSLWLKMHLSGIEAKYLLAAEMARKAPRHIKRWRAWLKHAGMSGCAGLPALTSLRSDTIWTLKQTRITGTQIRFASWQRGHSFRTCFIKQMW